MKTMFAMLATLLLAACGNNNADSKTDATTTTDSAKGTTGDKTTTNAAPPDSATMMKNWNDFMTVGTEQKKMAEMEGNWNATVTSWMDAGAPAMTSKGTAVNKMLMDGRYLQGAFTGEFNGMPFQGQSLMAYDNGQKKYVTTWIDNMGTGVMHMTGVWDEATKTVKYEGTTTDPMTHKAVPVKQVEKIMGKDSIHTEMYMIGSNGKEFKSMELLYVRKK
jgi:hypothetical protein